MSLRDAEQALDAALVALKAERPAEGTLYVRSAQLHLSDLARTVSVHQEHQGLDVEPGMRMMTINLRCETCTAAVHSNEPEAVFDWLERHMHLEAM